MWTATEFTVGNYVDSFLEYLIKGATLLGHSELWERFMSKDHCERCCVGCVFTILSCSVVVCGVCLLSYPAALLCGVCVSYPIL